MKIELRVARHEAVARRDEAFVARLLGMQVHVIFGMIAKIAAVVLRGHRLERQPAVLGLRLMRDQRDALRLEMLHDAIEAWIVEHDELPRASRSTMPMFFHTFTPTAPRAISASMAGWYPPSSPAPPKPFMEKVVQK